MLQSLTYWLTIDAIVLLDGAVHAKTMLRVEGDCGRVIRDGVQKDTAYVRHTVLSGGVVKKVLEKR